MKSESRSRSLLLGLALAALPAPIAAQPARPAPSAAPPSIEDKTSGLKRLDGFLPLFWDEARGQLFMEVARLDTELLHLAGLAAGLGSNDIGLDRGALAGSRIVRFERVGPKLLLVEPNHRFRATSANPAEVRAVRDAFARSVLWGFAVAAESGGRVLVDLTEFLLRDPSNIAQRLRPGSYRLEPSRSSVHMPMTMNFPKNTELEAELSFVQQPPTGAPPSGPGEGRPSGLGLASFFEGVGAVAASSEAASLRVHHSFVELPGPGYEPRAYDPRAGYFGPSWRDYAAPLGDSITKRVIARHRLAKADPRAKLSSPVKPIVYYLDPGAPEPIRGALLEGASWWNQAFEAAGYRNAFRVELLPEGVSPFDVRYNVINWVHRSTRGWSMGMTVTDPRTGEIVKGTVQLGSLRIRQDYLLAEGLLSPYKTGTETPPELAEWALARIRQLAAHEVGHTLGLSHNYYDSDAGRISVMDYPHPLVTLRPDGSLDHSKVYAAGIGEWDKAAIAYGYQHFPPGADEPKALAAILDEAWRKDLRFLTNQDIEANPRVDQWSNGTDPAAELERMMAVRRAALGRFGEAAIRRGDPLATLEEALVPLYLHHRYQVEAAASALGGQHYVYALRGDGREATRPVPAGEQRAALKALAATLLPSELTLPAALLAKLPPRPQGYGPHRELFPRYTGPTFDAITPAVVASAHTIGQVLDDERAARLVQQHALDPALPGLEEAIDALAAATSGAATATPYEAEVKRATERVLVEGLMTLAARAAMPQVRAVATLKLERWMQQASPPGAAETAHRALLLRDITRFLERPSSPASIPAAPALPPGAPIGEPALRWLDLVPPPCGAWERMGPNLE